MDLNVIKNHFKEIQKKEILKFEPTIQHFNVGDIAWIFDGYSAIEVKITDISNFSKTENDGGYIFYYYEEINITKFDRFKLYFNYYLSRILSYIKINTNFKIDPKFGSGHGELAGRNEVLFKDPQQAELDYYLTSIIYDINNFIDFKNNK